ncbi:CAP domain-containing protein [Streptomyces sp. NPDC091376]|uniref:CAP domain-containing protein n=1 Tax=Streptomyces sp. NPDC091376 TaxID=3365994 RepID=UPI0037F12254
MPVRTGLLGVSAAMAVGAVAVAAGLLPGSDVFTGASEKTSAQQVREARSGDLNALGGASVTPSERPSASVSRGAEGAAKSSKGLSSTSSKPSPSASATPAKKKPAPKAPEAKRPAAPEAKAPAKRTAAPERRFKPLPTKPPRTQAPVGSGESAAEAEVLALVNQERAKVGCSPVRPKASLASLADRFSSDMAARGFFDHTDPDGDTPWDRASQAGVGGLGGENIARGQADARTVMNSWMNSDGHRANILNCEYRTLGVGVSFAEGGPWWTQDFGY